MKKYRYYIIAAIVLLVLGGFFYFRHSAAGKVQYQTAAASKQTITVAVSGSGNVVADQAEKVDPTITGTVYDLSVKTGDVVKKNQLLFKIQNDSLQASADKSYASYLQAQQGVLNAQAQEAQAQADLDDANAKNDSKAGTVSDSAIAALQQKLSAAQMGVAVAQQNVKASYSDYQNQKTTAAQRTVTAPIDGTVTTVSIANGDNLGKSTAVNQTGSSSSSSTGSSTSSSSSSTPIIIENFDTLKASIQVNEVDVSKISVGQKASMTFDAIDGLTQTGKVEKIDLAGTVSNGVVTYSVTIGFDSIDKKIKSGMSVTANITLDVKQNVLSVPNAAVKISGTDHWVQILSGGQPQQVVVGIGAADDTNTEITSGLNEGDQVITQTINSGSTSTSTSSTNRSGSFGGGGTAGALGGLTGGRGN